MAYNKYDTLVRKHRENLGLTQAEAADRAGVSLRTYCNIERYACGKVKNKPNVDTLERVADGFGVPFEVFCGMLKKRR